MDSCNKIYNCLTNKLLLSEKRGRWNLYIALDGHKEGITRHNQANIQRFSWNIDYSQSMYMFMQSDDKYIKGIKIE